MDIISQFCSLLLKITNLKMFQCNLELHGQNSEVYAGSSGCLYSLKLFMLQNYAVEKLHSTPSILKVTLKIIRNKYMYIDDFPFEDKSN